MISIGDFTISTESSTFIVAELSANHNQKIDIAIQTIKAAKKAGANAIKFQTYTPDTLTIKCDNEYFRIKSGTPWDDRTLYDLYKDAYTPWEWHMELFKIAKKEGLICFSTPFDRTAVDFLEELYVPVYKIASFEITDTSFINYVARKGKPIIISTGIATLEEIENAIEECRLVGNNKIILLKCTSQYPAPLNEANLLTIPNMRQRFGVEVGLSDHTMGNIASITAVACGAKIIEKHFILDRNLGGPDASFSMQPEEFKILTDTIHEVEKALGSISYELSPNSLKSRSFARSLFVVKDIKAGEIFTEVNIRSIRPGYGLSPKYLMDILGKKAMVDLKRGTPLKKEYISS